MDITTPRMYIAKTIFAALSGKNIAAKSAMIGSFALLAQALKVLPLGTAYAVWTGIGAAGTAILGILWCRPFLVTFAVFHRC